MDQVLGELQLGAEGLETGHGNVVDPVKLEEPLKNKTKVRLG